MFDKAHRMGRCYALTEPQTENRNFQPDYLLGTASVIKSLTPPLFMTDFFFKRVLFFDETYLDSINCLGLRYRKVFILIMGRRKNEEPSLVKRRRSCNYFGLKSTYVGYMLEDIKTCYIRLGHDGTFADKGQGRFWKN